MDLIKIRRFTLGLLRQDTPDESSIAYPEDWLNNVINIGYREMQELTGSIESYVSLAVTDGIQYVAVPADFEAVKQLNYKYSGATGSWPLKPLAFQDFDWSWGGKGRPAAYHIRQDRIYLSPIPNNSTDTLDLYYYTIPAEMTLNTDTPTFPASFHHYLGYYAAYCCKLRDRDPQRAEAFKKEWEEGKKELRIRTLYKRQDQEFPQVRDTYQNDGWY